MMKVAAGTPRHADLLSLYWTRAKHAVSETRNLKLVDRFSPGERLKELPPACVQAGTELVTISAAHIHYELIIPLICVQVQ